MRFDEIQARLEAFERSKPPDQESSLQSTGGHDVALREKTSSLFEERFASPAAPRPPFPQLIGPYQLEREIGRGGMGVVYLASRADEQFDRRVAIKLMSKHSDGGDLLERFHNERQILANLDHPNICRMFDGGMTEDGEPYLVMEYISGAQPIDEYCDQHKLTVRQRVELFKQVCRAVQYAHQLLIVHRDLKPDNILVAGDGVVKLMDFGLAKNLFTPLSVKRMMTRTVGFQPMTPAYASPEQVQGRQIGTATDIYSLGVILYELLTGCHPLDGGMSSVRTLLEEILTSEPPAPSSRVAAEAREQKPALKTTLEQRREASASALARSLTGDLDSIVLTAIQKEPERRYGSVEQLEDDLRRYLGGFPVKARPNRWGYRAGKFVQRHKTAVASAVAFTALISGFSVTSVIQARRIAEERDTARQVSAFLEDLFQISDPEEIRQNALGARAILDNGAARIEHDLKSQPEVQSKLMGTLAKVYFNLGYTDAAIDLWRKSLALREEVFGKDSLEAAESMNGLARSLQDKSDFSEAESYARESLRIRLKLLPQDHELIAGGFDMLGLILQSRGQPDQAEQAHKDAIEMLARLKLTNSDAFAVASSNLGGLYSSRGQWGPAEQEFRRVLEYRVREKGQKHPRVTLTMNRLGQVLNSQGKYAEAEKLFRDALAIQNEVLSADHPFLVNTYNNLASLLQDKGDFAAAEPMYRKALELGIRKDGEITSEAAIRYNNIGTLMEEMERYPEAQSNYERSLEIRRGIFGESSVQVARTMNNLARASAAAGDTTRADRLARQALEMRMNLLRPDHPDIAASWFTMGRVAERKGDLKSAGEWHARALELRRSALNRSNVATSDSMLSLAAIYLKQGRAADGEPLLREAVAARTEALPAGNWRIAEAKSLLGECLTALRKFEEAESLLMESDTVLRDRPQTAAMKTALARLPALHRARARQ